MPARSLRILFVKPLWLAIAAALLGGCLHGAPRVIVPVQKSAADQYAYAKSYQASRQIELILNDKQYLQARQIVTETYKKVAEYFPDDRVFTPVARLDVIIMQCGFDGPRLKLTGRREKRVLNRAIDDLADLSRQYPEHEYIQAMALFQRGQCHKRLGDFEKAQECFKSIMDTYKDKQEDAFKSLVYLSTVYYNQVYTQ